MAILDPVPWLTVQIMAPIQVDTHHITMVSDLRIKMNFKDAMLQKIIFTCYFAAQPYGYGQPYGPGQYGYGPPMGPGYGPPPGPPSGPNQGPSPYGPGYGYQPYPPPPRGANHLNGPNGPPGPTGPSGQTGPNTSNGGKLIVILFNYLMEFIYDLRDSCQNSPATYYFLY